MGSNFKRGQSRVWFGSLADDNFYDRYMSVQRPHDKLDVGAVIAPDDRTEILGQGSQISFKSQDSGFSDHHEQKLDSLQLNDTNASFATEDGCGGDESRAPTPPTVIRRVDQKCNKSTVQGRRIQFGDPENCKAATTIIKTSTPNQSPNKEDILAEHSPIAKYLSEEESCGETFEGSSMCLTAMHSYENPLLNNNSDSVQFWFQDKQRETAHEVLSMLQSKPLITDALKYRRPNTGIVVNIIQYLRRHAKDIKAEFMVVERELCEEKKFIMDHLICFIDQVQSFAVNLRLKRKYFLVKSTIDNQVLKSSIDSLLATVRDFQAFLEGTEITREVLVEKVQILKCYTVKILQTLYENLIRVILKNLKRWNDHPLICYSILTKLTDLCRLDCDTDGDCGFLSTVGCFQRTDIVKYLITVCINHIKDPLIPVIALRAIAMVCNNLEAIYQFERADGVWILREVLETLMTDPLLPTSTVEPIIREVLSVLAQITAPWHRIANSDSLPPLLKGIHENVEIFVDMITTLIRHTNCCQIMLLAIASLNNLSNIEPTTIYSMMSHNTIYILKSRIESWPVEAPIFIYVSLAQPICIWN